MRSSSDRHWPEDEGLAARALTVGAAVGGAALVSGIYSANKQSHAAQDAAGQQAEYAQEGIAEQRRQFDAIQKLLSPYVAQGTTALTAQGNLTGLNGADAQGAAIQALQSGPQFQSMLKQGESSILANASATGGLRGGNTQAALAQFSPALLSATINDQYARLGGLSSMGLGAATQTGNFGQASTGNVQQLLQQQGAALAGGSLAQGRAQAGYANAFGNALGAYGAFGGFSRGGQTYTGDTGLSNAGLAAKYGF
jgi:hypothetical protein